MSSKLLATVRALPYKIPNTNFIMSALVPSKFNEATAILAKTSIDLEPLNWWCNYSFEDVHARYMNLQKLASNPILSVEVTDPSNKVVGVALNREINTRPQTDCPSPTSGIINDMENRYQAYFKKTGKEGEVVCIDIFGIANEAKGKGLGSYIVQGTMTLGHKEGFKWVIAEATNVYSAKIFEKLGFKKVFEIVYDDYVLTINGKDKGKYFKGLNEAFTAELNKRRPKDSQLKSAAPSCIMYEADISNLSKVQSVVQSLKPLCMFNVYRV
eukprot:TRINITY_DN1340_c0_g1_i2.p2 TRINITY_DN1340_c0_g1~~TRINITY_DN1340_c0_g1_i2.p2  ORF type:complete len:270 (-),score=8.10 TRINITY_DN1340_c0_g1_i2:57-866(-)